MPIDFVFFQLPNMSIYFNQILAAAALLYILYFFIQAKMLDMGFKEHIKERNYWLANVFINVMKILPIAFIIFAMYNIDNPSLLEGLKYNECQTLINKYNNPTVYFIDINGSWQDATDINGTWKTYSELNQSITRIP